MYTYISKSLCCTPEINTILSINYTSIRQIKRKKEKILEKRSEDTNVLGTSYAIL